MLPEGTYPPIISQKLFDRLQERLQRNKEESSRRSKRHEEYLLRAGFIHCGYCGRRMHTRVDKNMKVHSNRPKRAMLNKYGELIAVPEGYQGSAIERLVYRCKGEDNAGNVWCKGQELRADEVDVWAWADLQKLADHIDIIKTAIELATNNNAMEADVKAIEVSLASWRQKATNYLEDLDDLNLRGDSRASIRQSLNAANQHIEELEVERTHVLMGLIDRDRERQVYGDILKWCETAKEARGELTYQQKRDFLYLLGVTVIAKRGEAGKLDLRMEISLPEIRELIGQTDDIEEHDQ